MRNRWIGLRNTVNTCDCADGYSSSAGQQCRSLWTWVDGADATTYESWPDAAEPGNGEACVRLVGSDDTWWGTWWGVPCGGSYQLTFICKWGGCLHANPFYLIECAAYTIPVKNVSTLKKKTLFHFRDKFCHIGGVSGQHHH